MIALNLNTNCAKTKEVILPSNKQARRLCNNLVIPAIKNDIGLITERFESFTTEISKLVNDQNRKIIISDLNDVREVFDETNNQILTEYSKKISNLVTILNNEEAKKAPQDKNFHLKTDGICPENLKKCPWLYFRGIIEVGRQFATSDDDFSKEIDNLAKYDIKSADITQRPENKLIAYLTKNNDDKTCKFRSKEVMGGYIGYTEAEINRNLEAACWNLALAGCCATSGPDQIKDFIIPEKFYALFSPILFDNSRDSCLILGSSIFNYDDLKDINRRCQVAGIGRKEYEQYLPHKLQIEAIWKKLNSKNPCLESLGKEVMSLYLKIIGFEVIDEKDKVDSPYAIAMYTDNCSEISWQHWGIEVQTNQKAHVFETLPFCSLGHRLESFKSAYKNDSNFVFSIPVKNLSKQQLQRINEIVHFGLQ